MLAIFGFFALFTSTVSAIIGMGGGVLLLSLMTFFLSLEVIIPVHGLVQLASNSSRVWILRKHVQWNFYKYFILGLPLGAIVSTFLLKNLLHSEHLYLLVILLISYALFKPKNLPPLKIKDPNWFFIGLFTGVSAILIGAVGPLIAPFFLRDDIDKRHIISTKAMMQTTAHLIKIPAFLALEFNYLQHWKLILIMTIAAIVGTKLGVKLLHKVNDKTFRFLYKSFLSLACLRLIYKLIWV